MRLNPFNPQIPAKPKYFIGRETELKEFERCLLQTMNASPMNMCVTGNRGMGKTSLLVKMDDVAKKHNCLVFRMSNYEGNVKDINQLTDYLIIGIKTEIYQNAKLKALVEKFGDWVKTLRPTLTYGEINLSFEEKKIAAQSILRTHFLNLWMSVNSDYKAIVLLIDEAESLEKVEGALGFIREVFQRLSHDANYMIVLSGKMNFSERMSESFSPLNRFFPIFTLKEFSGEEVSRYMDNQLSLVQVTTETIVKNKVYEKSQGHPYVVVEMCSLLFEQLEDDEDEITMTHLDEAYPKMLEHLEKDFFQPAFHPLTEKTKRIAMEIGRNAKTEGFSAKEAVKFMKTPANEIAPHLKELVLKGCLNKPERAQYQFFHPLFHEYLKKKAEERLG